MWSTPLWKIKVRFLYFPPTGSIAGQKLFASLAAVDQVIKATIKIL